LLVGAIGIAAAYPGEVQRLTESEAATKEATEETIRRLALAAELRDEETGWHIERMSRYAGMLAARVGMDSARCELIRLASSMHDVGKIGVPDRILLKKGTLSPAEFEAIKEHPGIGYRIPYRGDRASVHCTHYERGLLEERYVDAVVELEGFAPRLRASASRVRIAARPTPCPSRGRESSRPPRPRERAAERPRSRAGTSRRELYPVRLSLLTPSSRMRPAWITDCFA
jgi:hypothetical protein